MTKKEIKTATDNELIYDALMTYSSFCVNYQIPDRGTKQLSKHLDDLTAEMLRRNLLTQEQIDRM